MECQSKSVGEIVAMLVQGSEIGANGAKGIETEWGTEAAGDFLFHLGHAHILLGDIVGEGNTVIGHETPDIVGGARGLTASPSARIRAWAQR